MAIGGSRPALGGNQSARDVEPSTWSPAGPGSGQVVELRVHGVSGTPPESLLKFPAGLVTIVYGDGDAGFHRRRVLGNDPIGTDEIEGVTESADGPELNAAPFKATEAFAWGGLTSGPASRALWLLFLPFILINLAHWMLPPNDATDSERSTSASAAVCLLRLLGLTLTITLLVSAADCLIDVVAWQCLADHRCAVRLGPLQGLECWRTGWVLALAALPIAGLVLGLLLIGRSNPRLGDPPPDPSKLPRDASPLTIPSFWNADESITRLRHCHVAAWLSGLGLLLVMTPLRLSHRPVDRLVLGFTAADAVCFLIAVAATWSKWVTGRNDKQLRKWATNATRGLWIFSLVSVIGCALAVGRSFDVGTVRRSMLPGMDHILFGLIGMQALLLILLFVAIGRSRAEAPSEYGYGYSLRGYTAAFVATMAFLIGGGISLGAGLWLARFLGEPVRPDAAAAHGPPITLSTVYFSGALANVVLLGVAVLTVVAMFVHVHGTTNYFTRRLSDPADPVGFPPQDPPTETEGDSTQHGREVRKRRTESVARAWAWAEVTDGAPRIIGLLIGFTFLDLVGCWMIVSQFGAARGLTTIVTVCGAITAFLMAVVIGVAYKAFRQRSMRRVVGVLWDVMTFWPQASHPFGPPCYGQRAVPDLRDRIWQLAHETPGSAVVIAAHSQGTIIAAAALLLSWKKTTEVGGDDNADASLSLLGSNRVALLTFGSPLRRLYARNFPAYLGHETLAALDPKEAAGRWINLWAHSDPIGGWVLNPAEVDFEKAAPAVDRWMRDVTGVEPVDGAYPPICEHSGFWLRDEYRWATDALAARIGHPPAQVATYTGQDSLAGPEAVANQPPPPPIRLAGKAE